MRVHVNVDCFSGGGRVLVESARFGLAERLGPNSLTIAQHDRYLEGMKTLIQCRLKELQKRLELDAAYVREVLIRESCNYTSR